MIDLADILIGATAVTYSIPIKHFDLGRGLEIVK
jgi:hypothetical protein